MAQQRASATGPDRFLIGIVGGAILLIVVSVAVVLLVGRSRPSAPADPNSPAGVVQNYVQAVRAGDVERARSLLTRQSLAAAEARNRSDYTPPGDDNVRIVFERGTIIGDTAEVKVTISRFYTRSDPFSSGTTHRDVTVHLVREEGAWRISQPPEPYAFY